MCLCLFLHRILRLYAQENAVDDTIYFLGEALRKGVIELEVFLKVRGCPSNYCKLHDCIIIN